MEEKKHVGRPTNEEVASRKKKKVVKYSLIIIVSILLVGGIALFFNRDKIDFSSLMGLSIFKTYKYVVNDYNGKDGYYLKLTNSSIKKVDSCKVSNSKYASCEVFDRGEGIFVMAKKSGTATIKVKVINKKNKVSTKTIRVKIGADFKGPKCEIYAGDVKRGSFNSVSVVCDEKVYLTYGANDKANAFFWTSYRSVKQKACKETDIIFTDYIDSFERFDDYHFMINLNIPKSACLSDDFVMHVESGAFKDGFGNINPIGLEISFKITK